MSTLSDSHKFVSVNLTSNFGNLVFVSLYNLPSSLVYCGTEEFGLSCPVAVQIDDSYNPIATCIFYIGESQT